MIHINHSARVSLSVLAASLFIPILGIALQSEAALERFHNRTLSAWPEAAAFRSDPVGYFRTGKEWFADRAFPIIQATRLEERLAYFVLGSAPEPQITLGKDEHVFLNGGSSAAVNAIFASACVRAHNPRVARSLEANLQAWAKVGRRRRLRVDVILVPTAASLYADKLPDAVPLLYRQACLERMNGKSPLLEVRAPAQVHFLYPLHEMLEARADVAFFPRGNWHPTGLSLKVVRDAYLARLGVTPPGDERLELGQAPAENLVDFGIEVEEPTYFLRNENVSVESLRDAELRTRIADLFIGNRFTSHVFSNSKPAVDETLLMLSDSFGDFASVAFAGAFRQLIHINANDLELENFSKLIDRLQGFEHLDRLLLLQQEGNAKRVGSSLK